MDYAPAVVGAVLALVATWGATGYQHLLYRQPEYRVPPRDPGTSSTARRVLIVTVAALGVAVALRPGHVDLPAGVLTACFILVLSVMASTDLERRLLPNRLMYPALAAALALVWAWPHASIVELFAGGAAGLLIGGGLFVGGLLFGAFLGVKATPFGLGDVKLMVLIGLLVGWDAVLSAFFIGIVAAGVPALVMTVLGRGREVFAYGPFLILGALVVLLWPAPFD